MNVMSHDANFHLLNLGGGDWEDSTPEEKLRNQAFYEFVFKESLLGRVQRYFLWPMEKVHEALAEYMKLLILKEELEDFDGRIVLAPPILARVWENHIVDTAEYRNGLEKILGSGMFLDHNPDLMTSLTEEVRAEKVSQLTLFYKGKFGRDPNPLYWSFDESASNYYPPGNRFGSVMREDDGSRRVNPGALYPCGSGRFSRDFGFQRSRPSRPGATMGWRRPPSPLGSPRRRFFDEDEHLNRGRDAMPRTPPRNSANNEGTSAHSVEKEAAPEQCPAREPESGAERDPGVGHQPANKVITFVVKCKEPFRFRHVVKDCSRSTTVTELKAMLCQLEERLQEPFSLTIIGSRIDLDDGATLAQMNVVDGDIITIQMT